MVIDALKSQYYNYHYQISLIISIHTVLHITTTIQADIILQVQISCDIQNSFHTSQYRSRLNYFRTTIWWEIKISYMLTCRCNLCDHQLKSINFTNGCKQHLSRSIPTQRMTNILSLMDGKWIFVWSIHFQVTYLNNINRGVVCRH